MQLDITLPIKTVAESNSREHWHKKATRHSFQQMIIRSAWNTHKPHITLPCTVTLTRLASRKLDAMDALPMAFKWISDEIAAQIFPEKVVEYKTKRGKTVTNKGQCDNDERITWRYAQEPSKIPAIRIQISYPTLDNAD